MRRRTRRCWWSSSRSRGQPRGDARARSGPEDARPEDAWDISPIEPRMRVLLWASAILVTATTAAEARPPLVMHASAILPRPVPALPVARWTSATGRTTMSNGMLLDEGDEPYRMIAKQGPP